MGLVVVDYGAGNIGSIVNMIRRCGGQVSVSANGEDVLKASKLILPGVGAFDHGMRQLSQLGLIPILNELALARKIPVLGICLGMQLMTRHSEEGQMKGLAWIAADTIKFRKPSTKEEIASPNSWRIPHMGWNVLKQYQISHPLFKNFAPDSRFYFVHSFHVICDNENDVLATSHHGYNFAASIGHGNIMATQYHPEKSHKFGMQLIKNFLEI